MRSYRGTMGADQEGIRRANDQQCPAWRITSEGSCQPRCPPRGRRTRHGRKRCAARSYAVRLRDVGRYSGYDICDTTACQVYGGMGRETSNGNAAVRCHGWHDRHLSRQGQRSPNSRHPTAATAPAAIIPTSLPNRDPYDGVIKSRRLGLASSARAASAGPGPRWGTVKQLQITSRDGAGAWGGRVKTIKIIGTSRTATVSGTTFQHMFGMRSSLYMVAGSSTPVAGVAARRRPKAEFGAVCRPEARVRRGLSSRSRVGRGPSHISRARHTRHSPAAIRHPVRRLTGRQIGRMSG